MRSSILVVIVTFSATAIAGTATEKQCSCRKAASSDRSHGANEVIELRALGMTRLRGRVVDINDKPLRNEIVEVFRKGAGEQDRDAYEIAQTKRRERACVTGESGEFCFSALADGVYIVRVGSIESAGMQQVHFRVTLGPRAKGWRKTVTVVVPAGT